MAILFILKWLGFVILAVFVLTLLAVCLVLFVPIHYKIKTLYENQMDLRVESTWLFSVFAVLFERRDGKTRMALKIFGADKKRKADQDKNKPEKKRKKDKKNKKEKLSGKSGEPAEKKSLWAKICSGKEKWDQLTEFPDKKALLQQTWLVIQRLIQPVLPCVIEGEALFGFDDPSQTGLLLGAGQAAVGLMGWGRQVSVRADFDKKVLVCKLDAAGRFRLWSLTWPLAAYALSKPVWLILKRIISSKKAENKNEKGSRL